MADIQPYNLSELTQTLAAGDQRGQAVQGLTGSLLGGYTMARDANIAARKAKLQEEMERMMADLKNRSVAVDEANTGLKLVELGQSRPLYNSATGQPILNEQGQPTVIRGATGLDFVPGRGLVKGADFDPGGTAPTKFGGGGAAGGLSANDRARLNKMLSALDQTESIIDQAGQAYAPYTEDKSRFGARVLGPLVRAATTAGVLDDPAVKGIESTLFLSMPLIIKGFGDAGNVPQESIELAIRAVGAPGLKLDERYQTMQNFIRQFSGMIRRDSPELFNSPEFQEKLKAYDIDPASIGRPVSQTIRATKAAPAPTGFNQMDPVIINGKEYDPNMSIEDFLKAQ